MSDRIDTFEVAGHAHLSIRLPAANIRLKEGDQGRIVVQMSGSSDSLAGVEVDATIDTVTIRSQEKTKRRFMVRAVDAVVTLPPQSAVTINVGTGDILVGLPTSELEVNQGSGDVRVDDVSGATDIKVGSGDVRCGQLTGTTRIASASGDIRIDSVVEMTVSTAAGDLYVGEISESARIKSATGDIRIRKFSGTDLDIKTMSGDAHVAIIPGMIVNAAIKTLSGDLRNRIKPSQGERVGTMNLTITSFSGDVILRTAK